MPISFKNVFYTYSPKTPYEFLALKDATLEIKDKSFTCIVGHTGCGKSTLIQQINGLLIPTSGSVDVNGFTVEKKHKNLRKIHNLRKEVGIVFQFSENQLFEDTIELAEASKASQGGDIGIKKDKALEIAHKYLEIVGIPEDYYKKSPFELSGGEKRRVALAGILALEPKVLILDEPTAGLDPKGTKEFLELFKKLNKDGITIILVTHDINIVYEYASDVIVMNEGRVEMVTTPSKLFETDVTKYSLEIPLIQKVVNLCEKNGMKLSRSKIHSIADLAASESRKYTTERLG